MLSEEMKKEAAERGAEWGRQEAGHQLEAVENGHQRKAAEWTMGTWCGPIPFDRHDDATADLASEYEYILDRAAKAAYDAAIAEVL
ncbi:MAG: hypothetical protein ACK58T_18870 [Phycisphaerae bacterium]|jgi:hypothetical protein